MSNEAEQFDQRRENLAAIEALGFPAYPHRFDTTHAIGQLVDAHAQSAAEALEASRVETVTAGRIVGIRSFGKARFLVLSDGR
jgi:lysyl-tRNA synthetase class 2